MPETQTTQTAQAPDPMRNFQFRLEIPGVARGHFTEVSGLGVRVHPIRYREGGYWLHDVSTNGTYLQDQRLSRATVVDPGARFRVGRTVMELRP